MIAPWWLEYMCWRLYVWRNEEIVKISNYAFQCDHHYNYYCIKLAWMKLIKTKKKNNPDTRPRSIGHGWVQGQCPKWGGGEGLGTQSPPDRKWFITIFKSVGWLCWQLNLNKTEKNTALFWSYFLLFYVTFSEAHCQGFSPGAPISSPPSSMNGFSQ